MSHSEPIRYRAGRAKDRAGGSITNLSGPPPAWLAEAACRNTPYDVAVRHKRTLSTEYGPGFGPEAAGGSRPEAATGSAIAR